MTGARPPRIIPADCTAHVAFYTSCCPLRAPHVTQRPVHSPSLHPFIHSALSWLRRRGPSPLPPSLYRAAAQRHLRAFDPAAGRVRRVSASTPLPEGWVLLVPRLETPPETAWPSRRGAPSSPSSPAAASPWLLRALRSSVLYQDANLLALNKPPGLAVQGGSGVAVSLDRAVREALRDQVPRAEELRLVHRLDAGASGVILLALNAQAAAALAKAFARGAQDARQIETRIASEEVQRRDGRQDTLPSSRALDPRLATSCEPSSNPPALSIDKHYWAAAVPLDKIPAHGRVDAPLSDAPFSVPDPEGPARPASTAFTVLRQSRREGLAWLWARPTTGRKHQVRRHLAEGLRAPILGDARHGTLPRARALGREWAARLRREDEGRFAHSRNEEGGSSRADAAASGISAPRRDGSRNAPPPLFLHCAALTLRNYSPDGHSFRRALTIAAPVPEHWRVLARELDWPVDGALEELRRNGGLRGLGGSAERDGRARDGRGGRGGGRGSFGGPGRGEEWRARGRSTRSEGARGQRNLRGERRKEGRVEGAHVAGKRNELAARRTTFGFEAALQE